MQDRFKFRAVLKTGTHSIVAEPHCIFDNGYLINIDDVQRPFEKKYPNDCFWEFIEEIEKQENCQEVSTDSEIIIFDSFDGLIQSTGLKDKNGKLIYEGDIVKVTCMHEKMGGLYYMLMQVIYETKEHGNDAYSGFSLKHKAKGVFALWGSDKTEIIGNIYEDSHLIENSNNLC